MLWNKKGNLNSESNSSSAPERKPVDVRDALTWVFCLVVIIGGICLLANHFIQASKPEVPYGTKNPAADPAYANHAKKTAGDNVIETAADEAEDAQGSEHYCVTFSYLDAETGEQLLEDRRVYLAPGEHCPYCGLQPIKPEPHDYSLAKG